jgi:hypothetical protein
MYAGDIFTSARNRAHRVQPACRRLVAGPALRRCGGFDDGCVVRVLLYLYLDNFLRSNGLLGLQELQCMYDLHMKPVS